MLALLKSEDLDVQIHAVKVVANLAAEGRSFPLATVHIFNTALISVSLFVWKTYLNIGNLQKEVLGFW